MPEFEQRTDLEPFCRQDWLQYVRAHVRVLSVVFPHDEWRKYLIKHCGEAQQKLSEDELILQHQQDVVELGGASGILATHDFIDAPRFAKVREILYKDLYTLFNVEQLKKQRMPRSPYDFRD